MLERFTSGAQPDGLRKLNALVDALNALGGIRGDDNFIVVRKGPGGSNITLNVQAVLARMPRVAGGGGGGCFPVTVTQTGGATGSSSTTCSFTYEVKDLSGTVLDGTDVTPISPQWPRIPNVTYTAPAAGSYGLAFWHGSTLVLWQTLETFATGC